MTQPAEMDCPTCSVSLVMTDRQGIEIDYCPKCRGVWLDRGELEKILREESGRLEASRPAALRDPAGTRNQRRRQSTWRRLFD